MSKNLQTTGLKVLKTLAALMILLAPVSSCGSDGEGSFSGVGASSTVRPTSCAVSKNNFGHPQSCQCPSALHYDERRGVCTSVVALK